jgi:hypothetical protein
MSSSNISHRVLQDVSARLVKELDSKPRVDPGSESVSGGKIVVDVCLSSTATPESWAGAYRLFPHLDNFNRYFEFNLVRMEPGFEARFRSRSMAIVFHLETGRWLMDITEPAYDLIRSAHASVVLISMHGLREEKLPLLKDRQRVDASAQVTVSRSDKFYLPDQSEPNRERIKQVAEYIATQHSHAIALLRQQQTGAPAAVNPETVIRMFARGDFSMLAHYPLGH